jgi:hypothetical protein
MTHCHTFWFYDINTDFKDVDNSRNIFTDNGAWHQKDRAQHVRAMETEIKDMIFREKCTNITTVYCFIMMFS